MSFCYQAKKFDYILNSKIESRKWSYCLKIKNKFCPKRLRTFKLRTFGVLSYFIQGVVIRKSVYQTELQFFFLINCVECSKDLIFIFEMSKQWNSVVLTLSYGSKMSKQWT